MKWIVIKKFQFVIDTKDAEIKETDENQEKEVRLYGSVYHYIVIKLEL